MTDEHSTMQNPVIEETESDHDDTMIVQRARSERAIEFLHSLMADASGYDERVWLEVKRSLEENRTSSRRRFDD